MFLKGYFYVGASLCRLCVSSVFGARAVFDVDPNLVFLQGALVTFNLIGGVVSIGGSKVFTGCQVGLPLCSVTVTALSLLPSCLSRSPEDWD